jgi:hypothetical protein
MRIDKNWLVIILVSLLSTVVIWWAAGFKTIYQNFDGPYYLVVAKSWYDKATIAKYFSFPIPLEYYAAHFPLYPVIIKFFSTLPLFSPLRSMLIVNLLASIAASITLFQIAKEKGWPHPLFMALAFLFVWPRMWAVRTIGSPETLFILWILLALRYFDLKKYWLAGLFGALATLTKSPGILLFPTFFIASRKVFQSFLIPLSLLLLFTFYYVQTGDFLAYFHSGDNIHLQLMPFRVFDTSQSWVGTLWLEEIVWIYLVGALGVYYAYKKDKLWGIWGTVFYTVILFVSHRDISRYSLPLIPVVLLGFSEIFKRREIRIIFILMIIPLFFYTLNFVLHNTVAISDWGPFSK